ncbi:MAG: hypothetical protein IKK15_06110, partial [Akkermansia sp.]|nr:hypothetical protein [Akkermansia sp.]
RKAQGCGGQDSAEAGLCYSLSCRLASIIHDLHFRWGGSICSCICTVSAHSGSACAESAEINSKGIRARMGMVYTLYLTLK